MSDAATAMQSLEFACDFELLYRPENASMALRAGSGEPGHRRHEMKAVEERRAEQQAIVDVATELDAVANMTVGELTEKYREVFGEPTRSRNKAYLHKKISWRIQELAEGGLSPRAFERIEELAVFAPARWRPLIGKPPPEPKSERDPRLPEPGTVLSREWGGRTQEVIVRDKDFEYAGRRYATLSRVAREITGTNWNGYLFFRLQKRSRSRASRSTKATSE